MDLAFGRFIIKVNKAQKRTMPYRNIAVFVT